MAFSSVKNPLQRKSYMALLGFLVGATAAVPGYGSVPADKFQKVSAAEPTYFDTTGIPTNPDASLVNAKATEAGIAAFNTPDEAKPVTEKAETTAVSYDVVELDGLPDIQRGGNKTESYPFSTLVAPKPVFAEDGVTPVLDAKGVQKMKYSSFFVPSTEKRPNPARALSSTATSAQDRFTDGREFTVRKAYGTDKVTVTGAYVVRVK